MSAGAFSWQRSLVLLAAVTAVLLTAMLGRWQLGRAAQKEALMQMRADKAVLAPVDGATLGQAGDSAANREGLLYRAVHLTGRWLPQHTVYLENRQMQSRPGFFVVTPLQITGTGQVVLVQRGWVPRSFAERTALPPVQTPQGEVQLQGHLAPWPSRMYDFGGVEAGPIRQNLDFGAYQLQTGLHLLELSVVQSGVASEGLLREWPQVTSGVEKHHGYAFQWFGLSALIALLYVWFQIVQPRRKKQLG